MLRKWLYSFLVFIILVNMFNIPLMVSASPVPDPSCTPKNQFEGASLLTVDKDNNLYVYMTEHEYVPDPNSSGQGSNIIKKMDAVTGKITTLVSNLGEVTKMTADPTGGIYFSLLDHSNNKSFIKKIDSAGNISDKGTVNGLIKNLAADSSGHFYYTDRVSNHLHKFDSAGEITPMSEFNNSNVDIQDIANDVEGNVYVLDYEYGSTRTSKITDSGVISKYYRNDFKGFKVGMSVDTNGNFYVPSTDRTKIKFENKGFEDSSPYVGVAPMFVGLFLTMYYPNAKDQNNNFYTIDIGTVHDGSPYKRIVRKVTRVKNLHIDDSYFNFDDYEFHYLGRPNSIPSPPNITPASTEEDTQTSDGLVITNSTETCPEVTHYKISNITGGKLYRSDGVTEINNDSYIEVSEGEEGLKFTPSPNANSITGTFTFDVQAALDSNGTEISGKTTATIVVNEVNDSPKANDDNLEDSFDDLGVKTIPFSDLLGNDSPGANENEQSLTIKSVDEVQGGTANIEGENIIFTPEQDFVGTRSFNYTIEDNGNTNGILDPQTDQATVTFQSPIPVMGGTIEINGDAKFGSVLTSDISGVTYTPYTDDDVPTYQWYRGETPILGANQSTYTLVEEDISETIKVTLTADGIHATGSVISNGTTAVEIADSQSPIAPELHSRTTTSITLKSNPGHVYSIDGGLTWQDSHTFEGLTPDTEYPFVSKIKATPTMHESEISESRLYKTAKLSYSITYDGNNHTGGTIPTDDQLFEQNENVVVLGNLGSLVRLGYSFAGWNTKADGSGMDYVAGATLLMGSSNVTLYAKWAVLNNGGNGGGASTGSTTEIITVDVDGNSGENLNKTPIQRTTETNGTVKDFVTMPDNIAMDTVKKAKEFGDNTARIIIPDEKDIVSETKVEVPNTALAELKSGDLNLDIYTENATVSIPKSSLADFVDDLYFRLVPIKKEEERQQVEERAKKEEVVKEALGDGTIEVVGRPMTIETNLTSRKVDLILPLLGVTLPKDQKDLEKFLNNLGIFIEHSDGDRVLVKPEPVEYKDGLQGLKFTIEKFSTFTIVKMDNLDEYFNGKNRHVPYIHGIGNGYFAPNADVTRAQMAAMLARNLDKSPTANLAGYKDVNSKHWAYADIMEAKNAGIMLGVSATKFDPEGSVTRAQMAAIAYRWIQAECKNDSEAFESCGKLSKQIKAGYTDVPANHWAVDAIHFLKATDIMIGYEDGLFHPEDKLTRAQAVKVLNRLFKRGPLTGVTTPTFKDVAKSHWAFEEIEEAAREHEININENGNEILK